MRKRKLTHPERYYLYLLSFAHIDLEDNMNSPNAIPSATVILPYVLREKAGNHKSIMVAGSTIREIIDALDHDYPGLGFNLCYETGELRPYVNIFLDRENIRYMQGLETPVQMGATIRILQSVAGGCS
jgi:molybdopterin synthase sulfur carrier subunit